MGESIAINGTPVKLGTCEDLLYVRRSELERIVASGVTSKLSGNLEPGEYLKNETFRYRFPFPDEDGQNWSQWMGRSAERKLVLGVPRDLAQMDHYEVWQSVKADGGFNVNVALPCPASKAFAALKTSPLPALFPLAISQQRWLGGELLVVVDCGWCGAKVRREAAEAGRLADYLKTYGEDCSLWPEVARRIMDGYSLGKAVQ